MPPHQNPGPDTFKGLVIGDIENDIGCLILSLRFFVLEACLHASWLILSTTSYSNFVVILINSYFQF